MNGTGRSSGSTSVNDVTGKINQAVTSGQQTNAARGANTVVTNKETDAPEQRESFAPGDTSADAGIPRQMPLFSEADGTGASQQPQGASSSSSANGPAASSASPAGPAPTGSKVDLDPQTASLLNGDGVDDAWFQAADKAKAAASAGSSTASDPTGASAAGGGGGKQPPTSNTPWPPGMGPNGQPGNFGSPVGGPPYGTAGNTFTDYATRQKAIQDDLNQAQTIYMQMAADRYKWMSTMMRIWQDMRTSVLENILGATKNMVTQFEKIQDGFIQLLES